MMENATREKLAAVARQSAQKPFHGYLDGRDSNIAPIIQHFPKWNIRDADRAWCAAFVYYCCVEAGFEIPYSPRECVTCSLAGCGGWEEFAIGDRRIEYHRDDRDFLPDAGDIVLFDRVFLGRDQDHIGIVLEAKHSEIITAEGNTFHGNVSGVLHRPFDEHIRAFIRIPNGFKY